MNFAQHILQNAEIENKGKLKLCCVPFGDLVPSARLVIRAQRKCEAPTTYDFVSDLDGISHGVLVVLGDYTCYVQ